jgi:uncharacterized protein
LTTPSVRPLPEVNSSNAFFWTAGEHGALQMLHCRPCDYWIHPEGPVCPKCRSSEIVPDPLSGRGEVLTFTVNHQKWYPELEVPYVIAVIELPEQRGLRLTTNIVGCGVDEVHIGMAVHVQFEHIEDVWVPLFAPVAS